MLRVRGAYSSVARCSAAVLARKCQLRYSERNVGEIIKPACRAEKFEFYIVRILFNLALAVSLPATITVSHSTSIHVLVRILFLFSFVAGSSPGGVRT